MEDTALLRQYSPSRPDSVDGLELQDPSSAHDGVDLESVLESARRAARSGGEVLRRLFGQSLMIDEKVNTDLVTDADRKSEEAIIFALQVNYPHFSIVSEECGTISRSSTYMWLVDPLDGTHNFVTGIPQVAVSIALLHHGEALAGVVYQPFTDVMWEAVRGLGSWRNGKPLIGRPDAGTYGAVVAFMRGYDIGIDEEIRIQAALGSTAKRVLSNWSPAIDWCLLAEGRIDGVISVHSGTESQAAGILVAEQAGALIRNDRGQPVTFRATSGIIASHSTLMLSQLARALSSSCQ